MFGGQSVTGLIERWQPEKWYRSEKKFEDDLADFLRDNLRDKVRTQGRGRIDIQVGDHIGIELKRNLSSKGKLRRLRDQVRDYDYRDVILVVCGYEQNYIEELNDDIRRDYNNNPMAKNVHLVTKDKNDRKSGGRRDRGGDLLGGGGDSIFGF